ncbi:glycosyltransferase family 2 protein [Vibrio barjaei]|uniref:glycosyltransferase family 2 protein n=1 Tax=Vibrio barjaei TaxID=1676683 RepID=UPI0022847FEF|nr:glycosyltransferase family 2 protein [Vibrio barjaei]MCY9872784.1 glycosyltransferase family 2 protein [Vibrio barjaei]
MALFISVVNHSHDDMICDNSTLKNLAEDHTVIVKSNTIASEKLKAYCSSASIHLIQGKTKKGFGSNNNEVFRYAERSLNMAPNDHFLVLNPDVEVENSTINFLLRKVEKDNSSVSTINLFRNREKTVYDNSIRQFPNIFNPIRSILGLRRKDQYDKSNIILPTVIDWAAGSFLLFQCSVFRKLQGFDENYFMYFEDVDICQRVKKSNGSVIYYPDLSGVHLAQHSNRNIFSNTFIHYIRSTFIYFLLNKNRK